MVWRENYKTAGKLLELGELGLALVEEGLLNVIGGVKLGWFRRGRGLGRLLVVTGQNTAVLGLQGPDPSLVVHPRPGHLPDPPRQLRVASNPRLVPRRHPGPSCEEESERQWTCEVFETLVFGWYLYFSWEGKLDRSTHFWPLDREVLKARSVHF